MSFRIVQRGGRYVRVAEPSWETPLAGEFSMRHGGRWNAPGSFPVVYLNANLAAARFNVLRKYAELPYGPEDLDLAEAPVLVSAEIATEDYVDISTEDGCRAAGLPASYPRHEGETIPWERCQPIGQRAWDQGFPGIACRSAAPRAGRDDEELAWFQRDRSLEPMHIQRFEDWFWPR